MSWFKRKIRRWLQEEDNLVKQARDHTTAISRGTDLDNNNKLSFSIHRARGGIVVETSNYDRIKDRHSNTLYVVTNEQDLGHEIAKIFTMESLRG
jgi:hypothetical protein